MFFFQVSDLDAVLFEVAAQSGDISSGTELLISISLLENRLQELMSNLLVSMALVVMVHIHNVVCPLVIASIPVCNQ